MKQVFIKVKTQFEAIHKYPEASKEVWFLSYPHRHTFFVTAQIEVRHNNRELEFFLVKDYLDRRIKNRDRNLNYLSCEMLNDFFYEDIKKKYGARKVIIETSEDNQRSAITYYNFKDL